MKGKNESTFWGWLIHNKYFYIMAMLPIIFHRSLYFLVFTLMFLISSLILIPFFYVGYKLLGKRT